MTTPSAAVRELAGFDLTSLFSHRSLPLPLVSVLLEERSDPSDAVSSISSLSIDAMTYGIGTRRVGLVTTTT